jgi:hypothetical protein
MCFVTELCAGSLDIYIGSKRKREAAIKNGMPELTDETILRVVKDVAAGLAFMREYPLCGVRVCCWLSANEDIAT